ncbi:MAG: HepT-like ribonuclease domain-containing protein, partial [Campylobacterota bacterium]|nr:HepT-like ribonuclease domain-containing protein [Campylobacterota bacterium]
KVSSEFDNVQNLLHNFTSWDSVIREFEIIGEASKYLLKEKLLAKDYQVVVDFRNHITHEYFGIDPNIVWTTINIDLDAYESTIIRIIDDIKPDLKQELIESFIEDNNYLDFVVKALEDLKNA